LASIFRDLRIAQHAKCDREQHAPMHPHLFRQQLFPPSIID